MTTTENPTTKLNLVRLTDQDIQNLVAFGNRADMKGKEADTWVDLKMRLIEAMTPEDIPEPEPDDLADASPGRTA